MFFVVGEREQICLERPLLHICNMNSGDDNNNSAAEKIFFPILIVTLKPAVAKYTTQDISSLYSIGADVDKLELHISVKRV